MLCQLFCLLVLLGPVLCADSVEQLKKQASALKAKGDASGALASYEKAAAAAPQSAEIQDEIGFLLAVLKRNGEAKQHFERAIQLQPDYAPASFHLGVLYWLEQDPNIAIPLLESAVPDPPHVFRYQRQT